jgi:hypothetical protein
MQITNRSKFVGQEPHCIDPSIMTQKERACVGLQTILIGTY